MELIKVIALLCTLSTDGYTLKQIERAQTDCHQVYLLCVTKSKPNMPEHEAIRRCILER